MIALIGSPAGSLLLFSNVLGAQQVHRWTAIFQCSESYESTYWEPSRFIAGLLFSNVLGAQQVSSLDFIYSLCFEALKSPTDSMH